jgi:hypothetical protein
MEVIHSRCGGLDVHKETVVACVRLALGDKVTREVRTFETTTSGLHGLHPCGHGSDRYLLEAGLEHSE